VVSEAVLLATGVGAPRRAAASPPEAGVSPRRRRWGRASLAADPVLPGPAAADAAAAPLVRAIGAERRYPGGRSVGPVDLEARCGEVLALMGPNGAGKSTLLRLMASADRPTRGRILWWTGPDPRPARRGIGYAADEPAEETTLSVRQATHFWCRQWVASGALARSQTDAALHSLGLGDRADEPVGTLSYGLRRRLALAQALAHRPVLALLDEPSAGLDPDGAASVAATLRGRAAAGMATVVASNDPEMVALVADRVAILGDGRVLRVATLAELLGEVPRRRVVELRVAEPATPAVARAAAAVPGVVPVSARAGSVVIEVEEGASLGELVAAADRAAGGLRGLEVRRPDLRDCFPRLSGSAGAEPAAADGSSPGAGGEPDTRRQVA
jgi:ABC-2 type transport system ATP-binding protein